MDFAYQEPCEYMKLGDQKSCMANRSDTQTNTMQLGHTLFDF